MKHLSNRAEFDADLLALSKRVSDAGGSIEYWLSGDAEPWPEPVEVAMSEDEAAALQRFNATLEPGARLVLLAEPPEPQATEPLGAYVHLSPRVEGRDPVAELEIRRLKERIRHQRRELRALHRIREMESVAVRRGQAIALDRYRTPRLLERVGRFVAALVNRLRRFTTWGE